MLRGTLPKYIEFMHTRDTMETMARVGNIMDYYYYYKYIPIYIFLYYLLDNLMI